MKTLQPITHRDEYTRAIEVDIRRYFIETIFEPLDDILDEYRVPGRENAISLALMRALDSGRIWYAGGDFYGQFSADISRELHAMGATFNSGSKSFHFAPEAMPIDLHQAITSSLERSRNVHKRIDDFLAAAQENAQLASTGIELNITLSKIRGDLYRQLESTLPIPAREFMALQLKASPEVEKVVADEFTGNLDKYIKNFLATEIPELRKEVQANVDAGGRPDKLVGIIQSRYGVTKRKAAFLAEQEASLYISKFREARYRELGIRRYVWATSHDERVRPDHRVLEGTTHSWDSPPVTNRSTGARNHPGEDYGCRCRPIPVVDVEALLEQAA